MVVKYYLVQQMLYTHLLKLKKILNLEIVKEKLISIMDSENVTFDDIYNVLNDFKKRKYML